MGKKIIKIKKYSIRLIVLLFVITLVSGCEFREILDEFPSRYVEVKIEWKSEKEKSETMRLMLYQVSPIKAIRTYYLPPEGGIIKVPYGNYSLALHNYDSETIEIGRESSYKEIQGFTNEIAYYRIDKETPEYFLYYQPDKLFVDMLDEVVVKPDTSNLVIYLHPKDKVYKYYFDVAIENIESLKSMRVVVTGLSDGYKFYENKLFNNNVAHLATVTYKKGVKSKGTLQGEFKSFSRSNYTNEMIFEMTLTDNSKQRVVFDITKEMIEGEANAINNVVLLKLNKTIILNKVDGDNDGGMFNPDLDDWGDEEDIPVIIK